MMQGFGIHTWRLINAEGKSTFVKFHFTPELGVHSLLWDEALKLAGVSLTILLLRLSLTSCALTSLPSKTLISTDETVSGVPYNASERRVE